MMDERQPQGLAGNGVLDLQLVKGLGNRRGPDHFVFDAVSERLLVDRKGHPTHDVVQFGLGQYVGNTVGHAEIRADGPVKDPTKDRKDVRRCAPDVDADQIEVLTPRNGFHDETYRGRSRHSGGARHVDQLLVSRGLLHHVLEKEIMDLVPGGSQVFLLQDRPNIFRDLKGRLVAEDFLYLRLCILVSRINQRQLVGYAKPWTRLGSGDVLRHLDDVRDGAAIGAARHEDHVRPHRANALDFLMRQPTIIGSQHVDHDRAGAQRCPLRTFARHVLHDAGHHHLQPAAGAAGGDIDIDTGLRIPARRDDLITVKNFALGELLDFRDRVQYPAGHVLKRRLHGRRRLPPVRLAIFVADLFDQNGLGRGAPAISRNDYVQWTVALRWDGGGSRHRADALCIDVLVSMRAISRETISRRSSRGATRSMSLPSKAHSMMGVST